MLIDTTYFEFDRKVIDKDKDEVKYNLIAAIAKYEAEFLSILFGESLAADFLAGITADPVEAKWADLLSGTDYYDHTLTPRKWQGLTTSVELAPAVGETPAIVLRRSPIADYVYYHYIRGINEQMTSISTVKNTGENSVLVSPDHKLTKAWNDMANWVRDLLRFMHSNSEIYGWNTYGYWTWERDLNGYLYNPYHSHYGYSWRIELAQKIPLL